MRRRAAFLWAALLSPCALTMAALGCGEPPIAATLRSAASQGPLGQPEAAPARPAASAAAAPSAAVANAAPASSPAPAEDLRGKNGVPADLRVVYNDMHAFHGGQTITVHADGSVEARLRERRDAEPKARRSRMTAEQFKALYTLLVSIEAWEQRVPERMPVPDESRARLTLHANGKTTEIWEWYNDLEASRRMVRVKTLLEPFLP